MKTISEKIVSKLVINKSEFYTVIVPVQDKDDVLIEINKLKNEYRDANHYCYAYIINDNKKSSDDKEPGGTAGVPMMEILNKYELNYVLCVVIRYFGGIKLGAGGLVRAYSGSVNNALKENIDKIIELVNGYEIVIEASYEEQKDIDYLLKNSIYKKEYNEKVIYNIECTSDIINNLSKYNILSINNKLIKKP